MNTSIPKLHTYSAPPQFICTKALRIIIDRLLAVALALGTSDMNRSRVILRDIVALCKMVRELVDHNWIVKRRAWVLACPERIATVRVKIGEAAIVFWNERCKRGLLDRPPPRAVSASKTPIVRKAMQWAEFALPLFQDGIYKPNPNRKEWCDYNFEYKIPNYTTPNRRNAPPIIFWPRELGASRQRAAVKTAPARTLYPSQHRRENAEKLGLDVNASIGHGAKFKAGQEREDKPP